MHRSASRSYSHNASAWLTIRNIIEHGQQSGSSCLERLRRTCSHTFGEAFFNRTEFLPVDIFKTSDKRPTATDRTAHRGFSFGSGRSSGLLSKQASGDSGICVKDGAQLNYTDARKNVSATGFNLAVKTEKTVGENQMIAVAGTTFVKEAGSNPTEQEFSKNYSLFCENLNKIQTEEEREHKTFDRISLQSIRGNSLARLSNTDLNVKRVSIPKHNGINGQMKLSLQYFPSTKQLRIIVIDAEGILHDNHKVFCKLSTILDNTTSQKVKSKIKLVKDGIAKFKEEFYFNSNDDISENVLHIRLIRVSKILRRSKVCSEAKLPLDSFDLSFDTTMIVNLQDQNTTDNVTSSENIHIMSRDRSINAEARSSLSEINFQNHRIEQTLKRTLSLPEDRRLRTNIQICTNSRTPNLHRQKKFDLF